MYLGGKTARNIEILFQPPPLQKEPAVNCDICGVTTPLLRHFHQIKGNNWVASGFFNKMHLTFKQKHECRFGSWGGADTNLFSQNN